MRSTASGLFVQNALTHEFSETALTGFDESMLAAYGDYFSKVNPFFLIQGLMRPGQVLTDRSIDERHGNPKAFVKTEFYHDWVRPQDFRHVMGGTVISAGHDLINFTYFRPACEGPYTQAEMDLHALLARHIREALDIFRSTEVSRAINRGAEMIVDACQAAIFALDESGTIILHNAPAEALLHERDGLIRTGDRIVAQLDSDTAKFQKAVRRAVTVFRGRTTEPPYAIAVNRRSGRDPLSVMAVPADRRLMIMSEVHPAVLMIVTEPHRELSLNRTFLKEKYGFDASEAALASRLLQGQTLQEAALAMDIHYETARTYSKKMFQKTQTHRQVELVQLLVSDLVARM